VKKAAAASRFLHTGEATLTHVIARRLADSGDKPWILTDTGPFTYRDLDRLACRLANGLSRLGVGRGDTVLLMMNNCVAFIGLWCALAKLGAIEVPVNCHYKGRLLAHVVNDSGARLIVADAEFLPRLSEVAPDLSSLSTVVIRCEHLVLTAGAMIGASAVVPYAEILADAEVFAAVRDQSRADDHVELTIARLSLPLGHL
jgi:carnitine-CoA ligase